MYANFYFKAGFKFGLKFDAHIEVIAEYGLLTIIFCKNEAL